MLNLLNMVKLPGSTTNPPTDGVVIVTFAIFIVLFVGVIVPTAIVLWRAALMRWR